MVKYPLLSLAQQQYLPVLKHVEQLPTMFEDSTHQLWHCDTVEGEMMLKICNIANVKKSTFWQGMELLFGVQLSVQLGGFERVYNTVTEYSPLVIPEYIASDCENRNKKKRAFILTKMISGSMVEPKDINDEMVIALAEHIAQLHLQSNTKWGRLNQAEFNTKQWPKLLQKSLKSLAQNDDTISSKLLDEVVELAEKCKVDSFVPIMLDLRWDQFLQQNGELTALVDLDAFVLAPKELELVLLEYLLNTEQAVLFAIHYQRIQPLPELSQVRKLYRVLLFLMHVLGEKKIDDWMEAAHQW